MANQISLLKSFVDGQGAGSGTYVTYTEDHDSNYTTLENTINTIIQEVNAFAGNNATLVIDLITSSSPAVGTGIVGADSFAPVAFITGNTQVQVPTGVAFTAADGRVETAATATLTGSGASGTRYVALQSGGTLTLESATSQGIMDLYSANWNGASFDVGTLAKLPSIIVDGDDFQGQRVQEDYGQGSDAAIPPFTYEQIARRLDDVVRIMGGELTSSDANQAALNPMAFGGAQATPGFVIGDGTTYDATTGLYSEPASNRFGISVEADLLARFEAPTANEPQVFLRAGTALATPPWCFLSDGNTGFGWVVADSFRAVAGGVEAMRWTTSAGDAQASFVADPAGDGSVPGLAVIGDPNTGFLSQVADFVELMTGGTIAQAWNANQQRNSATQGRASATAATFSVPNNAVTNVDLTTEQYDQGAYHDTGTNPDRMTVPTGHDGNFSVEATITFDESTSGGTPNSGDRGLQITVNGTPVAATRTPSVAAGDTSLSAAIGVALSAADIVRATGFQDSGGAMDASARLTVRHED